MPYIESIEEFAARQRCSPLAIRDRYLFPNGAQSDGHNHFEPPNDPAALATLRHEYLTAKLRLKVKRYNADRTAISEQARYHSMGAGPMPQPGWKEYLIKLAEDIEEIRAQLREIAPQLPSTKTQNDFADGQAQRMQRAGEVMSAIQQLPTY